MSCIVPSKYRSEFVRTRTRNDELFKLSIDFVKYFIQNAIDSSSTADEDQFKRDLNDKINVENCTELLFGKGYSSIIEVLTFFSQGRKFLFCLDRFDTEIQGYRKDTISRVSDPAQRRDREEREVSWIQGLVELIDNLRTPDFYSHRQRFYKTFSDSVDFCVPLPKDRFFEVQRRRRDSISSPNQGEINWHPFELLTMLRKRLQRLWSISDSELGKSPQLNALERYRRCLTVSGRRIPEVVYVNVKGGGQFQIDLFLGVLRHTFFRPRDVVIFFSQIISYIEGVTRRRSGQPSIAAINRIISRYTRRIVQDEFIGEFEDTIKNIRQIMDVFRGKDQTMDIRLLGEAIGRMNFDIFSETPVVSVEEKIRTLYEIGFLGVRTKDGSIGGFPSDDYDFVFLNPGIVSSLGSPNIVAQLQFAVHPVFIESLNLRLSETKPVLYLNWDRIAELDDFTHG